MLTLRHSAPSVPLEPSTVDPARLHHPALTDWMQDPAGSLLVLGPETAANCIADALAAARLSHVRLPSVLAAKLVLAGRGACLLQWDTLMITGPSATAASWRRLAHVAEQRWERHRDTVVVLERTHHHDPRRRAQLALGRPLYTLLTDYGSLVDLGRVPMSAVEQISRVESELLGVGRPAVAVSDGLHDELREALAPAAEGLGPGGLWVWKSRLQSLQTCEGLLLAREDEDFTLSDPLLIGRVVHLAAQTLSWSRDLEPEDVVRASLRALERKDEQVAGYLADVGPAGAAEVGLAAVPAVERYLDAWPAMPRAWRPAWEQPVRARVGRLTLSARPDLVLGAPRTGARVDGRHRPEVRRAARAPRLGGRMARARDGGRQRRPPARLGRRVAGVGRVDRPAAGRPGGPARLRRVGSARRARPARPARRA